MDFLYIGILFVINCYINLIVWNTNHLFVLLARNLEVGELKVLTSGFCTSSGLQQPAGWLCFQDLFIWTQMLVWVQPSGLHRALHLVLKYAAAEHSD